MGNQQHIAVQCDSTIAFERATELRSWRLRREDGAENQCERECDRMNRSEAVHWVYAGKPEDIII